MTVSKKPVVSIEGQELHLGIIQNKLNNLLGKIQACYQRMNMDEPEKKGIDVETEKLKHAQYNKEYQNWEIRLEQYESKVLKLTEL
jgi:hypothetical protein